MIITREHFISATGREPEHDDLERCNCPHAGEITHSMCGWDTERNKPRFEAFENMEFVITPDDITNTAVRPDVFERVTVGNALLQHIKRG